MNACKRSSLSFSSSKSRTGGGANGLNSSVGMRRQLPLQLTAPRRQARLPSRMPMLPAHERQEAHHGQHDPGERDQAEGLRRQHQDDESEAEHELDHAQSVPSLAGRRPCLRNKLARAPGCRAGRSASGETRRARVAGASRRRRAGLSSVFCPLSSVLCVFGVFCGCPLCHRCLLWDVLCVVCGSFPSKQLRRERHAHQKGRNEPCDISGVCRPRLPFQMPSSRDTAYVSGSARATT